MADFPTFSPALLSRWPRPPHHPTLTGDGGSPDRPLISRRRWLQTAALLTAGIPSLSGCIGASAAAGEPELVWGRRGISEGRFLKPRAIAIDRDDRLYIVDTTGRIQVFTADGEFLRSWTMPETANGRPTGLTVDHSADAPEGRLLVADTHYYRMLAFDLQGNALPEQTIGGTAGQAPGEFAFVTHIARDSQGNYYIGEYGESDRIQKFDVHGTFVTQWGGTGREPSQFIRPQTLVIDDEDRLWVVDACNHRIQRYDLRASDPDHPSRPKPLAGWGTYGRERGELYYPYDLALMPDGTILICEYGNQRLQRFTRDGQWMESWGSPGHQPGELYQPWGVVVDSQGRIHVLDSNNHRIQRLRLS